MSLLDYTLRIADSSLISAQRLSEWCSKGPTLEEDIAISNISLDLFGQANGFLEYVSELDGNKTVDDFAFKRNEREFFNFKNAEEYWFPEIRSMEGAIFVMSFVLYPYIYMTTRASFLTVPISFFQTSLIYGRSSFFSVALPLARPGIIAGLALVLMETVSDFGTVEYLSLIHI